MSAPGKLATDPLNCWRTPRSILDRLGHFDLDPCASDDAPTRCAARGITAQEDGLSAPWTGRVWCNPPYGRHMREWLERCAAHGDAIALVPPTSIGAAWLHRILAGTTIIFVQGRIAFIDPATGDAVNGNTAWSILIAWGERNRAALRECGVAGIVAELPSAKVEALA
ncbi:phage N-6-adenine-methyltransferase [Sphingomonas sp. Leaf4]|uniref:phage N-6-adenine-methyltransferase n=1 Tax=Sphingomonas sp. Leaf4 TaxID=2876553 RepID=UPI001E405E9F|nr:phage N-6-adenine-methyltransferase [Sphingomonas sp. Leaf4]